MSDLIDKQLGPVALDLAIVAGKLTLTVGDASVGVAGSISVDGAALLVALDALLDGKFPAEKGAIDVVVGLLKTALQAA